VRALSAANLTHAPARELPWWTRPSALNLLFVLPLLLVVIWAGGSDDLEVKSRNYLSGAYVALFAGLVIVSALGAWLGENVQQHEMLHSPDEHVLRAAMWLGVLILATYLFWYRSLVFNPSLLMSILMGADKPDRADIGTVTGLTSLVNLAALYFSLAGYLLFVRKVQSRKLISLTIVLLLFTFFRAYIWSERLAVADATIPLAVALVGNASPKSGQRVRKLLWRLGPYAALPALFVFFAVAEYFRSWPYYADRMEFWQFASGRFANYYYTSLNNGAGLLATTAEWPTWTFENVLYWLHAFPFGIGPWFSEVVGVENAGKEFLQRYGDPEYNTPSSFASITLDLGVAGAILYFFLSMFCAGILYSRYRKHDILAVMLFPSVLLTLFESFRYPYWSSSRAIPWLLGALVVLAVLWTKGFIGARSPSGRASTRSATS